VGEAFVSPVASPLLTSLEVARLIEEARGPGVAVGIHLAAARIIARAVVKFLVKRDGREVTGCPRCARE
jgi:hypothetical protein